MDFYSRYSPPPQVALDKFDESLAQQHFANEVNINQIIARYNKTGVMPAGDAQPSFGDFGSMADFQSAQNLIAQAKQSFDLLPSDLRYRFNNDPAYLLQFLEKEENRLEAVRLGLVNDMSSVDVSNGIIVSPET
ncbi:MAG: internal scaffolding protein [Arizlama microvirus]|nr:MAG: internal scaffolding protein [Arizlama microvirus]